MFRQLILCSVLIITGSCKEARYEIVKTPRTKNVDAPDPTPPNPDPNPDPKIPDPLPPPGKQDPDQTPDQKPPIDPDPGPVPDEPDDRYPPLPPDSDDPTSSCWCPYQCWLLCKLHVWKTMWLQCTPVEEYDNALIWEEP